MSDEESEYLGDAVEMVVDRILGGVHTCFPAIIDKVKQSKVNPDVTVIDVTSAFGSIDQETNTPEPVQILNVPLIYPGRTDNFIIRPPTDKAALVGSHVKISVCDTFLADWKKTGGTNTVPTDGRRFYRGDAVAEFGFYPDNLPWYTPAKVNTAQIKVKEGVFLEIGSGGVDMLRILADAMNILSTAASTGSGGPLVLQPSAISGKTIAQLLADFAKLYNPDPTP